MKKLLSFILCLHFVSAKSEAPDLKNASSKINYTKNHFGDFLLSCNWNDVSPEELCDQLSHFVQLHKNSAQDTPFLIKVPHENGAALHAIKKAGFTFFHANDTATEWIFKNNSSIPDPYTSQLAAGIIITKNDEILVVEEKTRRGLLDMPGGTVELQELVRSAASRELQEEVNLNVNPNKLKLLAITNRINVNRFSANIACYYYTIDHTQVSGTMAPNPNEIVDAFYASAQDIAMEKPINGLTISPTLAALVRHLLAQKNQSHHKTLLDERQHNKKISECNPNDTMDIEFIK